MRFCLVLCAVLTARVALAGDAWPQFRGPDGQGHTDATNLPTTWSEDENVAWKVSVPGRGWSSPVILSNRLWMTTALDDGHSMRALCLDRASGRTVWDVEVFTVDDPEKINAKNSYASPSPIIEGNRLWVHFGTYGTACLDSNSGEVLWTNRELKIDHKEGPGSTPILVGDLLVVNCDGTDFQYIVALDKRTGQQVWKTERSAPKNPNTDFRKAYSTPLAIKVAGKTQIVSTAADRAYGYDPGTGIELWHVDFEGFSNVPRPVIADDLLIIDTGYMKPQLWAIRPEGAGNLTKTNVAWQVKAQVPANPSPIVVGKNIYMVSDQGVVTCLEAATGKERYKSRLGGNFSASPIANDANVYFFSEEGDSVVLTAGDELNEIAHNKLDGRIMASPAVAGQAIFLRTETHLYRLERQPSVAEAAR